MKNLKMLAFAAAIFGAALFFGNVQNVHAQRGSFEWSGTVDDVTQVVIRNRNARTKHVSGRFYDDANFDFNGRAPRNNVNVQVDKQDGRGRIFIVQQPNRRNNFTTIVQIQDTKGGADRYRFRLYWDN